MPTADRRSSLAIAAVVLLGVLALVQHAIDEYRPPAAENRVGGEIVVTSEADRGEGSLREALFAAATAPGRVRVVVRAGTITLKSALPPLVNPSGTVIHAEGSVIDASAVGGAPVIDVAAPHSQVSGLTIAGAPAQAIVVRAASFHLAAARITGSGVGVLAGEAADGLTIEKSRFEDNGVGVRIEAPGRAMAVRENQFARHREAGIWMVRGPDAAADDQRRVAVTGNRFEGDYMSVVAGNMSVAVEKNEVVGAREAALYVIGRGVAVRNNQVRDGAGIGVSLQNAPTALVENNDISRQQSLGVLVRASAGATVQGNRVHGNGYGMAFVLGTAGTPVLVSENAVLGQRYDGIVVIGDSPVVRRNQSLNNGHAGVRILDFHPVNAAMVASRPFLEDNRSSGNRTDEVARGDYRAAASGGAR